VCGTKNVVVKQDELVASTTGKCEGGIDPIIWKKYNGIAG